MRNVLTIGAGFQVPDGTTVRSILDPQSSLREGKAVIDDFSLALGEIPPLTVSRIHLHPIVTQLTWVVKGQLTVKMKEPVCDTPYTLELNAGEGALTRPDTFFQLFNSGSVPCQALYFVTPAFIFETDEKGLLVYSDAIVFEESWRELAECKWLLAKQTDHKSWQAKRKRIRQAWQEKQV